MTQRIFRSVLLTAVAVLLSCFLLIMGVLYNYFGNLEINRLKNELDFAAAGVDERGLDYLRDLQTSDCRLTLVAQDGTVLYDTESDPAGMDNHAQREEIREAAQTGTGDSVRYSSTLTERTVYHALRLKDGSILRISATSMSILSLFIGMLSPVAIILVGAFLLSLVLARRLSNSIVRPLNNLDLEKPMQNNTYEEIKPLLRHIEAQHREIRTQRQELMARRMEFYSVIKNMKEGLLLLDNRGEIVSINPSAAAFFGTDTGCTGRPLTQLDATPELDDAIFRAETDGTAVLSLSRGGREYSLNVSRIDEEHVSAGLCILIFDVTERLYAERNRREFTANVSHELKTPLQSILGSAELLENGVVRTEDIPRFVGTIHAEASRLVSLVDDIIRLSQLDENANLPCEETDLCAIAREETAARMNTAEEKHVTLAFNGESAPLIGVPRLLREIAANLIDNAIKYNTQDGHVDVTVRVQDGCAVLTVADTGIGIPEEHQSRVFERFYRVDKSHSRAIGGTGLGLSIVKHAVAAMNGTISLKSAPGQGTTVSVAFPCDLTRI